ncbi:MAG: hypothetical protein WB816_00650, partial [Methylocystis sp.]
MTKLFDAQQLSAGVQEFEKHLRRPREDDWTVDIQMAKPLNVQPMPPPSPERKPGGAISNGRRPTPNNRRAASDKGRTPPAASSLKGPTSRQVILVVAALVIVAFAGAMSWALTDRNTLSAATESAVGAATQAIARVTDAVQPTKATPSAPAPAAATSEVYVATIRPDGSLAPDT